MKPEIKTQLVDALQSGDYQQGRARLVANMYDHDSGDYIEGWCCLGVLTDLHAQAGGCTRQDFHFKNPQGDVDVDLSDPDGEGHEYMGDGEAMPFAQTLSWAGVTAAEADTLATLNDEGANFLAISTFIKRYL